MIQLSKSDFPKVRHFIKSENELSTWSVIDGIMPGEIFANNAERPTTALIKTCECNLIAGEIDEKFISEISTELDFWDNVTPDSSDWFDKIPLLHPNKYIHSFKRRRYTLSEPSFMKRDTPLPDGFTIENVNLEKLRSASYNNADRVLEWAKDCGSDATFIQNGVGTYIRNHETIVSWSLTDCGYFEQTTIGVQTDENYRKQGFGIKAVSETIQKCFEKGYKTINWLCVDSNQGSISIAERLGFEYKNNYYFFCSYLPTENLLDIPKKEWHDWAKYLEEAALQEPRLIIECLYTYIKADDVPKTIEIIKRLPKFGEELKMNKYQRDIGRFQSKGLCENFDNAEWQNFVKSYNYGR